MIWECYRGDFGGWMMGWQWWQSTATAEVAPPPDPRELAERAVESMQLRPIEMGVFPKSTDEAPDALGYVGWNVWLWADGRGEANWGPISRSASAGGYTVTATARVERVVWDMGNGETVVCGAGTQWLPVWTRNEPSPTCGYVYEEMGFRTITATSHWTVDWEGIGQSGTLSLELEDTRDVTIAEIQVVNVTGR